MKHSLQPAGCRGHKASHIVKPLVNRRNHGRFSSSPNLKPSKAPAAKGHIANGILRFGRTAISGKERCCPSTVILVRILQPLNS